jgi:hypothetical protein
MCVVDTWSDPGMNGLHRRSVAAPTLLVPDFGTAGSVYTEQTKQMSSFRITPVGPDTRCDFTVAAEPSLGGNRQSWTVLPGERAPLEVANLELVGRLDDESRSMRLMSSAVRPDARLCKVELWNDPNFSGFYSSRTFDRSDGVAAFEKDADFATQDDKTSSLRVTAFNDARCDLTLFRDPGPRGLKQTWSMTDGAKAVEDANLEKSGTMDDEASALAVTFR